MSVLLRLSPKQQTPPFLRYKGRKMPFFTRYHIEITQSSLYTHTHPLSTVNQGGNESLSRSQRLHPNIALHLVCQHHHSVPYQKYSGLWHGLKFHIWHASQSGQWSVTSRLISCVWNVAASHIFNTGSVSWRLITLCAAWLAWRNCWQLYWGCCCRLVWA